MKLESKGKGSSYLWAFLPVLAILIVLYSCWDLLIDGPRFHGIEVILNQKEIFLQPNATLEVFSNDKIFLKKVKTNIPFNIGLKVEAKGIDLEGLTSSPQIMHDLLQGEWSQVEQIVINFSFRNSNLGVINILFKPVVEDWLERAGMILDPKKRLLFLKNSLISTDYDPLIQKRITKEIIDNGLEDPLEILKGIDIQRIIEPELLWSLFEIARKYSYSNIFEAIGYRILELKPELKEVYWLMGIYWEERSSWDKAEEYYKKGLSQEYGKEFMLGLARVSIGKGDLKGAVFYLNGIIEKDRDQEYYQLLWKASEGIGDTKGMVEAKEGYLGLRPGDLEGRLEFLEFLLGVGITEKVNRYVEEILERAVGETELILRLANILEKYGQRDLLFNTYNAMLKEGLREPVLLFNLGSIEYERGNFSQAKGYLEAYLEKEPKDEIALRMLMDIYLRAKEPKKYVNLAKSMLGAGVKEAWLYKTLCSGYLELGDYTNASRFGEEGIKSFPREKALVECLTASYLQQGKLGRAQEVLEGYLMHNREPDLLLRLSEIREATGDTRGAIKALEDYMKIQQMDQRIQERYLRLRLRLLEEKLN